MKLSLKYIVVLCLTLFWLGCDKPLSFDAQGVAHGTGERTYKYKSGAAQLVEKYDDGHLVHSRWLKPDGSVVQQTAWVNGTGENIYLREDGSIRARVPYVNGIAEGEATEYDAAGNTTKVMYHAGKRAGVQETATRPVP